MDRTMAMTLPQRARDDADDRILRARRGDTEAFADLVREHRTMVVRLAARLLGDPGEAEDVAQEALLRLHRHLGRIDARRRLEPWLVRVTVNLCRNVQRRRWRTKEQPLEPLPGAAIACHDRLEERADAATRLRDVMLALAELTRKEREVVVLRDLEGMDVREVGRALGMRPGTVRSHLSRGRLKIREAVRRRDDHAM